MSEPTTPSNESPTGSVQIQGLLKGHAVAGRALTVSHTLQDADGIPSSGAGAVRYQWLRDGSPIANATAATYLPSSSDIGHVLSVRASYVDMAQNAESRTSAATPAVLAPQAAPTIATVSGDSAITLREQSSVVTFKGTAPDAVSVKISIGAIVKTVQPTADGTWSVSLTPKEAQGLNEGIRKLTVQATDKIGQVSTTANHVLITDSTSSRIDPEGDGLFRVNFYSATSALYRAPEQLTELGGIGIQYKAGVDYDPSVWSTLSKWNLHTPFPVHYPDAGTGGGPKDGVALDQYVATLYKSVYAQATVALKNATIRDVFSSWYLPEEVRYWKTGDMAAAKAAVQAIRQAEKDVAAELGIRIEPKPMEQYQPNHTNVYRADSFGGLFDVIAKGAYDSISDSTYLRTVDNAAAVMVEASRSDDAARDVGRDFTPYIAMGASSDPAPGTTVEQFNQTLRAGFYTAMTNGIQGINVWSYALRDGFSEFWRDQYFDGYTALGREVNEVVPELGRAATRGLRLENLDVATPLTVSKSSSAIESARFFYDGAIYGVFVNKSASDAGAVVLSAPGDFTQYQELMQADTPAASRMSGSLRLALKPLEVRIFRFDDPQANVPSGEEPGLNMQALQLRQGLPGSSVVESGAGPIVKWSVLDPEGRGTSKLTVQVWLREQAGADDASAQYFFHTSAPKTAITSFTAADMNAGKIGFYYNGSRELPEISARVLDDQGRASEWSSVPAQFYTGTRLSATETGTGGQILFGDGSGRGGSGAYGSSAPNGVSGGGSADRIEGTSRADVIFGDGSGGGTNGGTAGRAGGGNDSIAGGAGNDIIFGDGFAASGMHGGFGGGGGAGVTAGSGSNVRSPGLGGVGAGDGGRVRDNWSPEPGESSTLGPAQEPQGRVGKNGGGGAGVAAGSDLQAPVQAYLGTDLYQQVLDAVNRRTGGDKRVFEQVMGAGNDVINAGAGADVVMAGYGNDRVTGGPGNDVLWGRGGAKSSAATLPADNDVFVWNQGDASGNAVDTIKDFEVWSNGRGDRLDIQDLLTGYTAGSSNLSQWVKVFAAQTVNGVGGSTRIVIDVDGPGAGTVTETIQLEGTSLGALTLSQLQAQGVILA